MDNQSSFLGGALEKLDDVMGGGAGTVIAIIIGIVVVLIIIGVVLYLVYGGQEKTDVVFEEVPADEVPVDATPVDPLSMFTRYPTKSKITGLSTRSAGVSYEKGLAGESSCAEKCNNIEDCYAYTYFPVGPNNSISNCYTFTPGFSQPGRLVPSPKHPNVVTGHHAVRYTA